MPTYMLGSTGAEVALPGRQKERKQRGHLAADPLIVSVYPSRDMPPTASFQGDSFKFHSIAIWMIVALSPILVHLPCILLVSLPPFYGELLPNLFKLLGFLEECVEMGPVIVKRNKWHTLPAS